MERKQVANLIIGWREWAALPLLAIPALRVKIDTGARTSSLHAEAIEVLRRGGRDRIRFVVAHRHGSRSCEVAAVDRRQVTDSGGHRELRWVIETECRIGPLRFPVELTLTDRSSLRFPMLLGRRAIAHRFQIDVAHSYLQGRPGSGDPGRGRER